MVFVSRTFSKHDQDVDFGREILCAVNVGGDELASLVLVPSEDIGTHYINNRMAQ